MIKNIANLGDAAIYCDFGSEVNKEINSKVIKYFVALRNKNLKSAIEDRKNMSFTESTIIATHENNFKILRKGKVKISEIRKVVKDEN